MSCCMRWDGVVPAPWRCGKYRQPAAQVGPLPPLMEITSSEYRRFHVLTRTMRQKNNKPKTAKYKKKPRAAPRRACTLAVVWMRCVSQKAREKMKAKRTHTFGSERRSFGGRDVKMTTQNKKSYGKRRKSFPSKQRVESSAQSQTASPVPTHCCSCQVLLPTKPEGDRKNMVYILLQDPGPRLT